MAEVLLRCHNLGKAYGRRIIFSDVNLTIRQGEQLAITGPSGSGKSTLLNMLGLLENPSSGQIIYRDQPYPKADSHQATLMRRWHINYIFQALALLPEDSVEANLILGMHYLREGKRQQAERMKAVLEALKIEDLQQEKVQTLSGGEQQRVAIARAILKPGELLLADEPTGSLDAALAEEVFHLLLDLTADFKKTLVLVTHDGHLARQCQRELRLTGQGQFQLI